jgi:ribonucleotide monophosphatase NagD (HAD superfamily)
MTAPTPPVPVSSIADLIAKRGGVAPAAVLLDQFGVLHDGRAALPGAVAATAALARAGSRVLILSNSSRRAAGALDKLAALGFDPACFAGALTSGEVTHGRLAPPRPDGDGDGPVPSWRDLGSRALHLTWAARGDVSLAGLGLTVVGEADLERADFILAHGTESVGAAGSGDDPGRGPPTPRSLGDLRALLASAARLPRPPPLLCANPDLVTVDGGSLVTMPGTLAAWYEEAGGPVLRLGKPARPIYQAALAALGSPDPAAVLAIGDSLEHDVAGASAAGIASLFIGGGIHGDALGLPADAARAAEVVRGGARAAAVAAGAPVVDPARLDQLLAGRPPGQVPTFVMDYLVA